MSFRFRLGPFTFGRTGVRLSLWGRGGGMSIPLSGGGRTFGKIGFGPLRWFFSGSVRYKSQKPSILAHHETTVIDSFQSDREFLEKILRFDMPWRGIQEKLKEYLPNFISDQDGIAYGLVPKALDTAFGMQGTAWKTEKRPSKSGTGFTTWVVIIQKRV